MKKGVRLGAVRQTDKNAQIASVFIPDASRGFISDSIQSYGFGETPSGNVPLRDRFENLAEIRPASLSTLWTDRRALPENPEEALWWECWTWRDQLDELQSIATQIGFTLSDRTLQFPDILIQPLHGSLSQLQLLIDNTSAVEQIRYASDSPVFFTTTVRREQGAWVNNLADRLRLNEADTPAVCLLDTGVARAHPLISGSLAESDCLTVQNAWGGDDHDGHGTNMAGSILFADLTQPLSDTAEVRIPFLLESVKLLPPPGSEPNGPESYGAITQYAVSLAEVNAPDRERAFCMALSNADVSGELPSSWSASIDQICAGSMIGDDGAPDRRRLFFVSAGNIQDDATPEHMEAVGEFPVEDPAQSWNAIAVGGFTNKSEIHPDEANYADWTPFAGAGQLSPYSRVSIDWEHSRTPMKPEIVFEAGNRALSPDELELLSGISSLSLLTTSKDFLTEPLTTFWATSPATAQAAGMGARLMAHDPSWWPESIRALMVHSATWTPWMQERMNEAPSKKDKAQLARHFGYGVPHLDRAIASAQNDLCMISQAQMQPYFREVVLKDGRRKTSAPKLHEMHVYDLPWPRQSLQALGGKIVSLRVTLSYFIEPNLGEKTPVLPGRYRSCGLRFQMQRAGESQAVFEARLNELARAEDANILPATPDPDWHFGNQMVSAGSVHSDIWQGTGAELALRNRVAIVPVGGWWKDRRKEQRVDSLVRYSLIISITSDDNETALYSEVQQLVEAAVDVEV